MFSTGFRDTGNQVSQSLAKQIERKQGDIQVSRTGDFVWFICEDEERLKQFKANCPDICQFAISKHYLD